MQYYYDNGDGEHYLVPGNLEILIDGKKKYVIIDNIRHDIYTRRSLYGKELFYSNGVTVSREDYRNSKIICGENPRDRRFYITKDNEKIEVFTRNMLSNHYIENRKKISKNILKKHYNTDKSKDTRRRILQDNSPQSLQMTTVANALPSPLLSLNLPNDDNGSDLLKNLLFQYQQPQNKEDIIDDSARNDLNEIYENIGKIVDIPKSENKSTNPFQFFSCQPDVITGIEADNVSLDEFESDMSDKDLYTWLRQL